MFVQKFTSNDSGSVLVPIQGGKINDESTGGKQQTGQFHILQNAILARHLLREKFSREINWPFTPRQLYLRTMFEEL